MCSPCGQGILMLIACVSIVYVSDFTFCQFEYMSSDSKQLHVKLVFITKKPLMIFKYSLAWRAFLPWVISVHAPPVESALYICSGCSFRTFILTGWVFKFCHMVCEKFIIWQEKDKIMKLMAFCGNEMV